jgi:hypothetical protein
MTARVLLVTLALAAAGCGYALSGRGNTLPPEIRIIGVPAFVNRSTTPEVDRKFTEAVQTEFQSKGRYTILPEPGGADAVLTVIITGVFLRPVGFNQQNQVTRQSVVVAASVEFKDKDGKMIWTNPSFQASDEYEVSASVTPTDAAALFRTDLNALDRLSRNFSRQLVTAIFEAF